MKRFIRKNGISIALGLGLALLGMIFILSMTSCSNEEPINYEEVIEIVTIVEEKEILIVERNIDIYEYTDILLWLLLNPDDDYRFYYETGVLHELEVSTSIVEDWDLILVVNQVLDSMTEEEIEGLTAYINSMS